MHNEFGQSVMNSGSNLLKKYAKFWDGFHPLGWVYEIDIKRNIKQSAKPVCIIISCQLLCSYAESLITK